MGWRFATPPWAEKKQEIFSDFLLVCHCVGGGYLVVKVRGKLTRCVGNENWKLFFFAFYTVIFPTTILRSPIYFISFSIYLHFVIGNKCIRLAIFFTIF